MIEVHRAIAAATKQAQASHRGQILPSIDDSMVRQSTAEARLKISEAQAAEATQDIRTLTAVVDARQVKIAAAKRLVSTTHADYLASEVQFSTDLENGNTETFVNPAGEKAKYETAQRYLEVNEAALQREQAPIAAARAKEATARDSALTARAQIAHAKLQIAIAEMLPPVRDELEVYFSAFRTAIGNSGTYREHGIREYKGVQEQMTRALLGFLTEAAANSLPRVRDPKADEPVTEDEGVAMYVRPTHNYGGAPAGSRVIVSEKERDFNLRLHPKTGELFEDRALETEEAYDARKFAAQAAAEQERERPVTKWSATKIAVEEALARLGVEGEARKAAREKAEAAEAARARTDEQLRTILAHNAFLSSQNRASDEDLLVERINTQEGE